MISPYGQERAHFMLKLHLASKGRNSPRETGNPSYLPEDPVPAPPAVRITDRRHLWYQEREDYQLEQNLTRPKRSKITPLVIENLIVWGAVITAVWWLLTQ